MPENTGRTVVLPMERASDNTVRHTLETIETKASTICQGFTEPAEYQQFWGGFIDFAQRNGAAITMAGAGSPYVVLPMQQVSDANARRGLDAIEQAVRGQAGHLDIQLYEQYWRGMIDFGQRNGLQNGIDLTAAAAASGIGTGQSKTTGNADRTLGGTAT